jgi:LPXTG-site transpeptidase (sortase) family protein
VSFIAGAAMFGIGLVGYLNGNPSPAAESEEAQPGAETTILSIDDVDNLPVAIPYYNPEITVAEPELEREVTEPLRMIIESIDVNAPVVTMGLEDGGIPEVPLNGQDVAWYDFSSMPGAGSNAVFAGHVNWAGAPGVGARWEELEVGDTIQLISEDGREYTYEVFTNFPVDPFDPESLKVMSPTDTDTVTLITCGGSWLPDPSERFGGNYSDRTIVQAKLIQPTLMAPIPSAISNG